MANGAMLEKVHDGIVSAFNLESLKKLLIFKLGKWLCKICNCEKSFEDLVLELLQLAEEEGWLHALLAAVAAARANRPDVVEIIRIYDPSALKPPSPGVLTDNVRVGLEAVVGLMNEPRVREILFEYRTKLERAREGITALNQYKKLHDVLHTLQQQLENKLEAVADEARKGEITSDVETFEYRLREAAENANEAAQSLRSEIEQKRECAWIASLIRVADLVKEGKPGSPGPFDRAAILFRTVLSEAPRISSKMTDEVANLNLDELRAALKKIRDQFKETPAEADLTTAIDGLATIHPRIGGLVAQHSEWQIIDKAVAVAEVMDGKSIDDRFLEWADTKARLENLFDLAPNALWANMLKKRIEQMESAGAAHDAAQFGRAFESFCSTAIERFVSVDKELLDRTGSIATVAPILARLV
jgi:hypothetical protein